jgi:hypothetical protein
MTDEQLLELLKKMQEASENWDTEQRHIDVDTLLLNTIALLADGYPEEVRRIAGDVIDAWKAIPKHYA